ncbi:MAG: SusD/RagB family nutrient-binding outer membrane lipoprotein [Bacteroidetes bacterium]|nr:SusD/RagB family nutrient-binding outer membrane lipoprotein [Bacteroidota bacterium]
MKKLIIFLLLIGANFSCQLRDDTVDPNNLPPSAADPDLLLGAVELSFANFYNSANNATDQLVRMQAMTGGYRYQTAITPNNGSLSNAWNAAYQQVLINTKALVDLGTQKNLTTHVGISKVLEAYVYLTLVDLFNDVPRTDALQGLANFSPKTDNAADVYAAAITLLGEARTQLTKTGADAGTISSNSDLFYPITSTFTSANQRANWVALANSLELKAWLNIRMLPARTSEADGRITALLTSNLIDTPGENFVFNYGNATVPDSRHPLYNQYYGPNAGSASGYLGNYFLNEMYSGRGVQDPRWRYYFYRQVGSINPSVAGFDVKALGCTPGAPPAEYVATGSVFCVFEPGFYGRDHGDASGTPPDSPVITAAGVYPAGGRLDNNPIVNNTYNVPTKRGDGANGAGIHPIFMYFFTDFIKAEVAARRGDTPGARAALNTAVSNSITAVRAFANGRGQTLSTTEPSTTTYLNAVLTAFDGASNKLDEIGREFYKAAWGNGVEAYNSYRRTSAPRNFQPTLQSNAGPWVRSLVYPQTYVALAGGTAKDPNVVNKVFWDGNTETLK